MNMVTISMEEYRRLQRISDAANYCIGWICGGVDARTKYEMRGNLEAVKARLEKAVAINETQSPTSDLRHLTSVLRSPTSEPKAVAP